MSILYRMKTKSKIYIIHFKDDRKIIGKSLLEIYNLYKNISNNDVSYDRFRYMINNDLYNTDKKYIFKGIEYQLKLDYVKKVEKEFLEDYFKDTFANFMKQKEQWGYTTKEYKDSVKKLKYKQFYNKFHDEFQNQVKCN